MKLKYVYIIIVSLAACTVSCTTDSHEEPAEAGRAALSFAVSDITRSAVTTSLDLFAVYGDMKPSGDKSAAAAVIFDKTEVKRQDDTWSYQGIQYWIPEREHSFVAIHPLSVLEAARYTDSRLSFTYTLPESHDDAADIVTATHRRLYREGDEASAISFRFTHLLSLVNFTLELTAPATRSGECIRIHKLEMSGFGTSAAIDIKPAPRNESSRTDDSEITIVTAAGGDGALQIGFDVPIEVTKDAPAIRLLDGNNAIIMLPQTFTADDKVQLLLTYSVNDEVETTTVSAELSGFKWESGKSYIYNIRLESGEDPTMVINNATITPWGLIDHPDVFDAS